jgi:hypothetical protein
MWIEVDPDPAFEELTAAEDADELCRLLLRSPWEWGSSTRHGEAVDLLRRTQGRGTLPVPAQPQLPGTAPASR